jgi:hypothetical protein
MKIEEKEIRSIKASEIKKHEDFDLYNRKIVIYSEKGIMTLMLLSRDPKSLEIECPEERKEIPHIEGKKKKEKATKK